MAVGDIYVFYWHVFVYVGRVENFFFIVLAFVILVEDV